MKKNSGDDETIATEGVINSDLLFCDDALVISYLNALLESAPILKLDSSEIHFAHRSTEDGWMVTGIGNGVFNTAVNFETERMKMEVTALRNDNENLKFKTELALIDAQVLRSKNDCLKEEITGLMAQQNEMQDSLDRLIAENDLLRSQMESLQSQSDISTIYTRHVSPHMHTDSAPNMDIATETVIDPDPGHVALQEIGDTATDQIIESELNPVVPQDSLTCIPTQEIMSDLLAVVEKTCLDDKTCSGINPVPVVILPPHVVNDGIHQKAHNEGVIFSQRVVPYVTSIQSARPVSNVIKQNQVTKPRRNHATEHLLKVHVPDPVRHDEISKQPDRKPDFVQQHFVANLENMQEENPFSNKRSLHFDDTDEISLLPAPDPKVVIKRKVKNYEDLQKESDSAQVAEAGHTIVL